MSTSGSSLVSRLVVGVGIKQIARCCYAKETVKWKCKIVDFLQNCEMKTVVTCSTTDGNGSCDGLVSSFFEEMTCCRWQEHRRRRPGNSNGRSKFRKYENLCLRDQANVSKNFFLLLWRHRHWRLCTLFFSYFNSQRLLFSPTKNNFSTTSIPPKNRDIQIVEFLL